MPSYKDKTYSYDKKGMLAAKRAGYKPPKSKSKKTSKKRSA